MVVLALTLAEITVLLIALDVANLTGNPGCSLPTNYFPVAYALNATNSPTMEIVETSSPDPFSITNVPSASPTLEPTLEPTNEPSTSPSLSPTLAPLAEGQTRAPRTRTPTLPRSPTFAPVTVPPLTNRPTNSAPQLVLNDTVLTPPCGGLNTSLMWEAIFYVILIFVALLIPFMIFFYEAFDVDRKFGDKVCEAVQNQGLAVVLTGVVLGVMYSQINKFSYPVNAFPVSTSSSCTLNCIPNSRFFNYNSTNMVFATPPVSAVTGKFFIAQVPISFGIYIGSFMSFFSWFLFALYTGVGLITLPVDLIARFRFRPRYIPKDVYLKLREDIRTRVDTLIKLGEKMKKERRLLDDNYSKMGYRERSKQRRGQRTWFLQFKKETVACEAEFEDIWLCHESWSSFNPLIPFVMLLFGIISICLSIAWLLQIVLFILPQTWPETSTVPTYFLNEVMTWGLLYSGFALLGVIFLAVFGLYLFACNLSGNFRIGLKFLLFEIHPMKIGGTYMSSFLVNVLLLLLQAPALVNFLAMSFSNTVVNTDVDLIMNWTVRYTTFFVYFFENSVFIFMLLASMALTFIFWIMMPDDRKANQRALKKRVEKMQATIAFKERQEKLKRPVAADEDGEVVGT